MRDFAYQKANEWINNPYYSDADRQEIQMLLDKKNDKEIVDRFYRGLEFGTGGLRGIIGMGDNRMNRYNVRKATQGLASEILKYKPTGAKVAIGYDSRHFSIDFAKEVASVMAGNGIKALIYDRLNPVGLVSFAVRYHGCQAGIMITASHNPPEYNGYKVYWDDGAQVIAPFDQNIINNYNAITDLSSIKHLYFDDGVKSGMISWIGKESEDAYYKVILSKVINPKLCTERGSELAIAYSPLHGTGLVPCTHLLKEMGFSNVHVVKEQTTPDGSFPTVKSPNPENAEALTLAMKLLEEKNADVVFATDPDCDRLGVALMYHGKPVYLNGNQTGVLLLNYVLTALTETNKMPKKPYFVKTIVTTQLQDIIAKSFHIRTENVLTGFKWICGKMREIENNEPEFTYIFGTEESFGYLPHDQIRDKDGPASVAVAAEAALWYKTQGLNLVDALDKIYEKHGFSHEDLLCLNYFGAEGGEKIKRIMKMFRENPPKEIAGHKITEIMDVELSHTINMKTGERSNLDLPKSNVLGFIFGDLGRLMLRPSGTEPKIKFYSMIQVTEGTLADKKSVGARISKEIMTFIEKECEKA